MAYEENQFIHDMVNKVTICHGKVSRIVNKPEKFSKEEILEQLEKVRAELDQAFKFVENRRSEMG